MKKLLILLLVSVCTAGQILTVNAAGVDAAWYAAQNPDVVAALGNSQEAMQMHYDLFGKAEGRMAHPYDIMGLLHKVFNAVEYAELYPDVAAAFGDDAEGMFNHYITFGILEGRRPSQRISGGRAAVLKNSIEKAMKDAGLAAVPGSLELDKIMENVVSATEDSERQTALVQVRSEVEDAVEIFVNGDYSSAGNGSSSGASNSSNSSSPSNSSSDNTGSYDSDDDSSVENIIITISEGGDFLPPGQPNSYWVLEADTIKEKYEGMDIFYTWYLDNVALPDDENSPYDEYTVVQVDENVESGTVVLKVTLDIWDNGILVAQGTDTKEIKVIEVQELDVSIEGQDFLAIGTEGEYACEWSYSNGSNASDVPNLRAVISWNVNIVSANVGVASAFIGDESGKININPNDYNVTSAGTMKIEATVNIWGGNPGYDFIFGTGTETKTVTITDAEGNDSTKMEEGEESDALGDTGELAIESGGSESSDSVLGESSE